MHYVYYTRGGKEWVPDYIENIDSEKCIGCGRCYKVCGRDVLELVEKSADVNDDSGDNPGNMVMSVKNPENCIGCAACFKVCPRKCQERVSF